MINTVSISLPIIKMPLMIIVNIIIIIAITVSLILPINIITIAVFVTVIGKLCAIKKCRKVSFHLYRTARRYNLYFGQQLQQQQ